MKLIIQICCLNEVQTLPAMLADLPRTMPGFDAVEWLVLDDGSVDGTAEVARQLGVDHVVRMTHNSGLARAFDTAISECLRRGADVIVNTDADNQYVGQCVTDLVQPILAGTADMVVGTRPIADMEDFSWTKKRLQWLGSWFMRRLTGTELKDATSGFRSFTREVALRMNVTSDFTYSLETLVAASHQKFRLVDVPIRTNRATRPSRLFGSSGEYILRQLVILLRVYTMYRPLRVFFGAGGMAMVFGLALAVRYFFYMLAGEGKGHIQSVVVAGLLVTVGFLLCMMGLLADIIRSNRLFLERLLYRVRTVEEQDTSQSVSSSTPAKQQSE
ncbi:MAG: glycosyltransferase family 2 protein [Planctomycetia bacterium]|jgi:glycosyltransferase involved in cell wall biosynthesis|nr:glycosyltransferase family 2 protein [Planctomycetia bacterium]MCC7314784.1 glycosyltransferase family 2 protein [Planctomycetota bacterium]OQZ05586.1 MAG: glycosyl transferase [Planctomycetes bacterium UTPLA1]